MKKERIKKMFICMHLTSFTIHSCYIYIFIMTNYCRLLKFTRKEKCFKSSLIIAVLLYPLWFSDVNEFLFEFIMISKTFPCCSDAATKLLDMSLIVILRMSTKFVSLVIFYIFYADNYWDLLVHSTHMCIRVCFFRSWQMTCC